MDSNPDAEVLSLWMAQPRPAQAVRLDDIRARAERLERKTRRWRVVTTLLFVLLLIVEAWQVWMDEEVLERAGDLLTIAAFVYVAYRFRKYGSTASAATLGSSNCVEFYRAELLRQRDLSSDSRGFVLPFVPGVALALFGGGFSDRPLAQMIAIAAFGVALFVGVALWNAYTTRRLQAEIDSLYPP